MKDQLVYLHVKGRGEAVRMMYAIAGVDFEDARVTREDFFGKVKAETPLGQVPVLKTDDGELCLSTVIVRHVAKKLGLAGSCPWEEALHDLVVESVQECFNMYAMPNIYKWKVFKMTPVPDNSEELLQKAKERWILTLKYIQSIAEKRGKKYIVGDELGLAELFLYVALEFSTIGSPDLLTVTPWTKEFFEKVSSDPKLTKHLAERPQTRYDI